MGRVVAGMDAVDAITPGELLRAIDDKTKSTSAEVSDARDARRPFVPGLPSERIALRPARPRDSARLLTVEGSHISDHQVLDLPALLRRGDVLVFNDTKVIPAQLEGRRGRMVDGRQSGPGPSVGATLHKRGPRRWQAFLRNAKRARIGDRIDFGEGVAASVVEKAPDGSALLRFHGDEPVELLLERAGRMPLPPYIASKRPADAEDRADYQTMFARAEGLVAKPRSRAPFHAAPARSPRRARHRPRDADSSRRCRNFPPGEGGRHRRSQDACRMPMISSHGRAAK